MLGLCCWADYSLVVESGRYSLVVCEFLTGGFLVLQSIGSLVQVDGLSCSTWDLPGSGIEPVSVALAGRFFTTEPPDLNVCFWWGPNIGVICLFNKHVASNYWISGTGFNTEISKRKSCLPPQRALRLQETENCSSHTHTNYKHPCRFEQEFAALSPIPK